jgi:hypothetical protein
MSELTLKAIEQLLDEKLAEQTRELKSYTREQTEELARMVAEGFDDIRERVDLRERVTRVEQQLQRIADAVHITL